MAIEPDNLGQKAERAFVEVDWKADTQPLHQVIDEIRATNPAAMPQVYNSDARLVCALAERNVAAAKDALLVSDEISLSGDAVHFTRHFRGRRYRAHDKRRAEGAIGFYCGTRGAGDNRPSLARGRSGMVRARFNRCGSRAKGGSLARGLARDRAASRRKGRNQRYAHDQVFGDDCYLGW